MQVGIARLAYRLREISPVRHQVKAYSDAANPNAMTSPPISEWNAGGSHVIQSNAWWQAMSMHSWPMVGQKSSQKSQIVAIQNAGQPYTTNRETVEPSRGEMAKLTRP